MKEIKEMFDHLVNEDMSREQVADWAVEREFANDKNELFFEPTKDKKKYGMLFFILRGLIC